MIDTPRSPFTAHEAKDGGASGSKGTERERGPGTPGPRSRGGSDRRSRDELGSDSYGAQIEDRVAAQTRPSSRTAERSSSSSRTVASMRSREKSSISRPWMISHFPSREVTGKDEMSPSGTP